MTGFSARRIATACAVSAASALAFMIPGAASASAACTGANIKGQGSTLQELAQHHVWIPGFNAKCSNGKEQITEYHGDGSGAGLASWGVGGTEHNFGPLNAFFGTDQPPNPKQKEEIEHFAKVKVLSIPTLQAAVAVIMHLPTGCTSAEGGKKGAVKRLVVNQKTVEEIFAGTKKKWKEITDAGDKLLPAGCEGESEITRVVRKEGSGTTAIFKKFLNEVNPNPTSDGKTWNQLAEENKNLTWPDETVSPESPVRAAKGIGVAEKVAELPGSIGYANSADAREVPGYLPEHGGGEKGAIFWAELQNAPGKEKYTDPSTTGEGNAKADSNCAGEKYVNGVGAKFPPKSTEEAWNEVTAALKQKNYALCGFTYDVSLAGFKEAESTEATSEEEVTTVSAYFNYILNEGQSALSGNDYLGLPNVGSAKKNVLTIAKAGAAKIKF